MKQSAKIGKGTSYILFGKILALFIAFLFIILVPRILGPENLGLYTYWFTVLYIFTIILDIGGSSIIQRYIPELRNTDETSILTLLKKIIGIKIPIAISIFIIGFFLFANNRQYFFIIFAASILYVLSTVAARILYSYKQMKLYGIYPPILNGSRMFLVIIFFILIGPVGVLYGIFGSLVLVFLLFGVFAINLIPKPKESSASKRPFSDYLAFGLFTYLGGLFYTLTNRFVVILSENYISDMAVIGFLGLGLQICILTIRQLTGSVTESVLPTLIEFHTSNNMDMLERSLDLTWKYMNILLLPLIFGLLVLAKPAIEFVVGAEFLPSVELIILFLPATVFITWSDVHQKILFTHEREKEFFFVQLIGFVSFLIAGLILIKNIGIVGAPISVSIGTFVAFAISYYLSSKLQKISSYFNSVVKPLMASVVMVIILSLIAVPSIMYLFGVTVLGATVYFITMFIIKGITRKDIERVKDVFK